MSGSLPDVAYRMLVCVTGALIVVLLARLPLRYAFGPRIAYLIWFLVPIAAVGSIAGSLAPTPVPLSAVLPLELAIVRVPRMTSMAGYQLFGIADWIVVGWIVGVVLFAVAQWWHYGSFVRRLGTLRRMPTGAWLAGTEDIGPLVLGAFPPRIVLPADFDRRYTLEEKALVLAHESVHVARRDPLINIAMTTVQSLLWFHPLIHVAAWYFRIDQELACDATVLQHRSWDRYHYAHAMLKSQTGGPVLSAGCGLDSYDVTFLKRRISMLQTNPLPPGRRMLGMTTVALVLIFSGSFATFVSAQDRMGTPAPISFDSLASSQPTAGNNMTLAPGTNVSGESMVTVLRRRDGNAIEGDSMISTVRRQDGKLVEVIEHYDSLGRHVELRPASDNNATIVEGDSVAQRQRHVTNNTVIEADSVVQVAPKP